VCVCACVCMVRVCMCMCVCVCACVHACVCVRNDHRGLVDQWLFFMMLGGLGVGSMAAYTVMLSQKVVDICKARVDEVL
jgi:hypothetical protein